MARSRRRLSRLSLKKHFRKSLMYDHVEHTIPNKSLSIIEISSTDSDSSESNLKDASYMVQDTKTRSSENSDCDEIISPSPNKNENLKCLSTGKKIIHKRKLYKTDRDINDTKINVEEENQKNDISGSNAFLGNSILDYDAFKTPISKPKCSANSTMLDVKETRTEQQISPDNSNLNVSSESVNKSFENVLDEVYGKSWRPFKEKVLPKSERKPTNKKAIFLKQTPVTESKVKKSETYKNPYLENEKKKSNNLLKALQTKKIRELIESPLIQNVRALCDEEGSEESDVFHTPKLNRIKLTFNEDEGSQGVDNENGKTQPNFQAENKKDICWSDKENSFEELSLEERIRKKKSKQKYISEQVLKENPNKNTNNNRSTNDLASEVISNENGSDSKTRTNISQGKVHSSQIDAENNRNEDNSSCNECSPIIVGGNVKKTIRKTFLKKYFDSPSSNSESDEVNSTEEIKPKQKGLGRLKKTRNTKTKHTASSENNVDNQVSKGQKTNKLSSNSSDNSGEVKNLEKDVGKNVKKRVLKTKIQEKKLSLDSSSNSDDNDSTYSDNNINLKKKNNESKIHSFLASLSSNVPDNRCDPGAKVFKATYKNTKEELAKKLFSLYNENIFDNRIPSDTPLEWNARMLSTAGFCYSKRIVHRDGKIDREARIVLSSKVLTTPDRLRDTLAHEMCHAAAWLINEVRDGHGNYFKAWATKSIKVFPELPSIKTCHNYEINFKYVYKCTGCGYSVNRHRKSLDIERKRCGHCLGKFEIFINKVNKKGEQNLIPADTPKKQPKGFALFVKENYSKYKNTNSSEVMKLLGKEFRQLKVQ